MEADSTSNANATGEGGESAMRNNSDAEVLRQLAQRVNSKLTVTGSDRAGRPVRAWCGERGREGGAS